MQKNTLDERCGREYCSWPSGTGIISASAFDTEFLLEDLRVAIKCSPYRTIERFRRAHHFGHATFSRKLNGEGEFSIAEIACFFKELGLPLDMSRYLR